MTDFNTSWKSSTKPSKQRKYRSNAPHHVKGSFLNARVADDLQDKYGKRTRIRVGDTVEVMRGDYSGREGQVEDIDVDREKIYINDVGVQRKDGTQAPRPIHPSNLRIISMEEDTEREDGGDDDTS